VSNVIFIEFFDKKHFPPGKWLSEPDLCSWEQYNLPCLALRDMSMGIWKGFVGLAEGHPFYNHTMDELIKNADLMEIFFAVYGGLSGAGRLAAKYKEFSKNYWWLGIETSHGSDLMPLLKMEMNDNPEMAKLLSGQTYKDLQFIRRETNKLAKLLSKTK